MEAVMAVVASTEVLVAVGGVLQLMCALPFPGKFAPVSCVCTLVMKTLHVPYTLLPETTAQIYTLL